MSRPLIIAVLVLAALTGGFALWRTNETATPAGFALFSDAELAEIAANPQSLSRELSMTQTNGPVIKVSAPSGYSLRSPVDFDIRVEPRGGIAVDMSSLSIEYKLGPVWVNLTRRVMKEATVRGSQFLARGAELPPGNHSLRLTARDADQRTSRALVTFTVAK